MRRVFVVILLVHTRGSFGQFYAQGVGKSTYSCSDAKSNLEWLLKFLPSSQDPYPECEDHTYCTCGVLGRVVLDAPGFPLDSRHVHPPLSSNNGPGLGWRPPREDTPNSREGRRGDGSSLSQSSGSTHYDARVSVADLAASRESKSVGMVSSSSGRLRGLSSTSPSSASVEAQNEVLRLPSGQIGGGGRSSGNSMGQGMGLNPNNRPGQGMRPGPGEGRSSGQGKGQYPGSGFRPAPHSPPPPREKIARGFGLHTVQITEGSREHGALSVGDVEACVSAKVDAVAPGGYDAFLDFSTGFWTSDLDPYLTAFTAAKQKILPVEWAQPDEVVTATEEKAAMAEGVAPGTTFFSFLVQVPNSMVILEFMSQQRPKHALFAPSAPIYRSPHPRFVFQAGETPLSVFGEALSQTPAEAHLQVLTSRGIGVAGDGPSGPGRRFANDENSDNDIGSSHINGGGEITRKSRNNDGSSGSGRKGNRNLHVAPEKPALFAARLSHMTTNAMRDSAFYSQVLGATQLATFTSSSGSNTDNKGSSDSDNVRSTNRSPENLTQSVVLDFRALFSSGYDPSTDPAAVASGINNMPKRPPGTSGGTAAYTQLHLVQRPAHDTSLFTSTHDANSYPASAADNTASNLPEVCRGLTVGAYEAAVVACHEATLVSPTCGWNAWMDHHFSLSDPSGRSAKDLETAFRSWKWPPNQDHDFDHNTEPSIKSDAFGGGSRYHVFTNKNGGVSFYAIAPNGVSVQITNPPPGAFERPPNLPGAAGDLCTSCEEASSISDYPGLATGTSTYTSVTNSTPAATHKPVSNHHEEYRPNASQGGTAETDLITGTSQPSENYNRSESAGNNSHSCPKTCSYNDAGPFTCAEVDEVGGQIAGRCDYDGYDLEVRAGCECSGCSCNKM